MAAISLHALQLPQLKLFVHQHAPMDMLQCKNMKKTKKKSVRKISAIYGHDYEGKMVDENMVVLRKRIHDMKMDQETPLESEAARWMEWEKKYYSIYCSDVCEAVALLQRFLMDCRPALGLGMGFLVLLSMFMPVWMIGVQLMELANKGVAAVIHI